MAATFCSYAALVAAALAMAPTAASAQATQTATSTSGTPTVARTEIKGEVVSIKDDVLLAKMIPGGEPRLFSLQPGKTATVDGKVMPLNKVPAGTILTADVYTIETPVTQRTVTTLNGTVWYASPRSVIVTLENGENRQYDVPNGFKFNVDGQMKEAMELRPGMKLDATKIVESPRVEVRQESVVTGTTKK